jgi:hypothetical protein
MPDSGPGYQPTVVPLFRFLWWCIQSRYTLTRTGESIDDECITEPTCNLVERSTSSFYISSVGARGSRVSRTREERNRIELSSLIKFRCSGSVSLLRLSVGHIRKRGTINISSSI